ncbi:MAG: hypothetical protein IIC91_01375 [Chloroflexi bacterium]|nr:hypothetical protein [Chloroflexota bacterium]
MKLDKTGWIRLAWHAATAVLAVMALFAGLGHQPTNEAHAATANVNVGQTNGGGGDADEYNAADITISEGDTVDWDWYDGVHDVTAYVETTPGTPDWQSPLMTSSATFSQTFNTASVVTYYCTIHATRADADPGVIDANIAAGEMVGKVTVEAAAADTPIPTDEPPTDTPTETPVEATATATAAPPTATSTAEPPTATPAEATATAAPPTATATEEPASTAEPTATDAPPTATATSAPETATPINTPSDATATAVPPTVTATDVPPTATATEEPASTAEPTATQPGPTPQPRTVNVEAGSEWFGNAGFQSGSYEITINAGDTVQWNIVESVHTVYECGDNWNRANDCAGAAWNSDILQAGGIYSQRFSAAGTYYYLCTLHPLTMRGTVTVEGSAPPNAVAPIATPTGNPGVSSPGPSTGLPNSGSGPLSQEFAQPDSPLGRAIFIAAAVAALLAAALVWKEVAWRIRN